ncbi:hypothetical protein F5Y00DRAFT_260731 [Daldinia vernicosa]|uniref:uncharacterized protein n=1 Tax=Daldinia vernicosa TaxID=114800 RepID=UPI002007420D|nr:uncharacterized protein F5Y00DRAFT_260731 [Daldinia vernicosa]KAI0850436.1 hypothetical protein F5Y00DRAFT_260731 [Daldinia vernicosa]
MKISKRLTIFTPISVNTEVIEYLLRENRSNGNESIRIWSEAKLKELQFVGVLGALMASLLCSAFTWPLANNTIWVVTSLWYSGLVFILASVATATQQSITLSRFSCLEPEEHAKYIKGILARDDGNSGLVPRTGISFVMQIPVMMLRFGIYFFMAGLGALLGYTAWEKGNVFSSETKKDCDDVCCNYYIRYMLPYGFGSFDLYALGNMTLPALPEFMRVIVSGYLFRKRKLVYASQRVR